MQKQKQLRLVTQDNRRRHGTSGVGDKKKTKWRKNRRSRKNWYAQSEKKREAFISWHGCEKLRDLLKWMNTEKTKDSFHSIIQCVVSFFCVCTTKNKRMRNPELTVANAELTSGMRNREREREPENQPTRTAIFYLRGVQFLCAVSKFFCCCLFCSFGFFFPRRSVHDSFEIICKLVHTLNSLEFCCVFFFHVFVFLLFSQSWTARKWFSNPDDCRPNWKKRIISSRMNFAIILFYFWFLCLCFALCCVLGELPLYFSVDFLVSLRSQNMTMSRICPATHTRI